MTCTASNIPKPRQEKTYPPSKNRTWDFFSSSQTRARFFTTQPLEPHQENAPTATTTASGMPFFRNRWYDPVTGRWLSNDPIGISGGLNQYVFCNNNPVNATDPWGLDPDEDKPPEYLALIPGSIIGSQNPGLFPPKPSGYNPFTWSFVLTDRGSGLKNPNGRYYFPHPEDSGHWRHWDTEGGSDSGRGSGDREPPNCIKPWPGQKRGLKPNQSWTDPSGEEAPFNFPMGTSPAPIIPFLITPAPGFSPAPISLPSFGFGFGFSPVPVF